uniref:receptor-like protein EIX1 n=1 Tax=Erigeron canadensis TaxID=72917 RepID=UPI001CB9C163|nr:receptor-like protein EIX1 [Erigeron canadensis]
MASLNVTCNQRERQSLLVFRQGLTDKSNRLSTWIGVECCEWQGVGCDMRNGNVVKLDLRSPLSFNDDDTLNTSNWLRSMVSPSLLNLKHLSYLDLSMNNFSGQNIPEFFGSFKYLEYLNLSNSGFSGVVPPHLGNLSRLQYLDLNLVDRYNMFSLPYDVPLMVKDDLRWVSLLSSLKHLDLSGITIGNHIDWFNPINMLPSLFTLNLARCDINIPSIKFINFTSLNSLDLYGNNITSMIPVWLSNLTGLMHLTLKENNFHGRIPVSIGTLSSLSSIDLSLNHLSGPIPPSLGGLSSLRELYLEENQLSGSIPESIGQLTRLQVLWLTGNQLNESIPESIGLLTRLERLSLADNQLSGSIPESIGLLTRLQVLGLSFNQLSGSIPTSLGQLSTLRNLILRGNQLSGVVSEIYFTKLNNLNGLSLSDNPFTLNVSPHWIPPFQLKYFSASSCNIGPQFPSLIQTSTHLEWLILSNSSIRDSIPEWFENISSHLQILDLSHNQIGGKLPRIRNRSPNPYSGIQLQDDNFLFLLHVLLSLLSISRSENLDRSFSFSLAVETIFQG